MKLHGELQGMEDERIDGSERKGQNGVACNPSQGPVIRRFPEACFGVGKFSRNISSNNSISYDISC